MYGSDNGPMFKDILEVVDYFHKNMVSSKRLHVECSKQGYFLVAAEKEGLGVSHPHVDRINFIELDDVSIVMAYLKRLNNDNAEANSEVKC